MDYAIHTWRISLILMLQPVLIGLILLLLWDRTFSVRREFGRGFPSSELKWIALILLAAGIGAAALVYFTRTDDLFAMPLKRPQLWLIIMVFYPLLSALPQELVYRTFFFHRYGALFNGNRALLVAVNGALFGFAHVMFANPLTMVLSGALGFLLAYRYLKTRSIWAVWLEHALYGQLVFSVGLGRYFYTGVSMLQN